MFIVRFSATIRATCTADCPRYSVRRVSTIWPGSRRSCALHSRYKRADSLSQARSSPHKPYVLKYGNYASMTLLSKLYEERTSPRLIRKWLIWEDFNAQPVTTRPYRRKSEPLGFSRGAGGGIRTLMGFRPADFESAA